MLPLFLVGIQIYSPIHLFEAVFKFDMTYHYLIVFTAGSKHQSHQDYMERADKARSQRLSSGSSSAK